MDIFIYEWKVYVWNGVMIMTRQGNRKAVKKEYRISARITKSEKNLLEKEKARRKTKSDGRCIVECLKESAKREEQRKKKARDTGTVKEEVRNLFDTNNLVAKLYRYQMTHEESRQDKEFNELIEMFEEVGKQLCRSVH